MYPHSYCPLGTYGMKVGSVLTPNIKLFTVLDKGLFCALLLLPAAGTLTDCFQTTQHITQLCRFPIGQYTYGWPVYNTAYWAI